MEREPDRHERLQFAVFLAAALHLTFILGLTFEASEAVSYTPQLEVTLATRPSEQLPDKTELLAAMNQLGSGDEADRNEITSREVSPAIQPEIEPQASQARPERQQEQYATPTAATAAAADAYITKEPEQKIRLRERASGATSEVDRLSRELASLEARLDSQTQALSIMPRVRRLTSASAKQAADAAYLLQWRQRLEAVGNKYYPAASERYGIYGNLQLLVVIARDGNLEDIQILSSSGHAVLDEAAIKIVRMAAPFAPFSEELRATTDTLEIIRTWQFQQNKLSSG
ncbi:MAG: protein TonB [Halioglobus sp.]|jgi:protein TonB